MTTTRTKHAGGTTVEVFDLTPFGFMGFNTNPLRQVFGDPWHLYGGSSANTDFVTTWTTTGSSESITLPLISGGTYNFTVDYGDSSGLKTVTAYNDADRVHTYAVAGTYTVTIVGTLTHWRFRSVTVSKNKIITVANWGDVGLVTLESGFYDCDGLLSIAAGVPDVVSMADCFHGSAAINNIPVGAYDLLVSCTTYQNCHRNNLSLANFKTGIPLDSVTTMQDMFLLDTLTTADYNALLVSLEAQTEPTSLNFHGGNSKHSGAGTTARGVLTGTSLWTITDGGAV